MGVAPPDVPTALVTGSTRGIGAAAAEQLGERGWTVLVHGRDADRGETVAAAVADAGGEAAFLPADFADPEGVAGLAAEAVDREVDVLVNNAGLSLSSRESTGWPEAEATFAVNHLAPYRLTHDVLGAGDLDRVVVTASGVHRGADLDLEDLEMTDYDQLGAYARSKLANVLFAAELAERFDGPVASYHPGFVPGTGLYRASPLYVRAATRLASVLPRVGTSVELGGTGLARLAAEEDVESGYYEGKRRREPDPRAGDAELRTLLWDVSAELVGVDPAWP